jgi:hypothetical protein
MIALIYICHIHGETIFVETHEHVAGDEVFTLTHCLRCGLEVKPLLENGNLVYRTMSPEDLRHEN